MESTIEATNSRLVGYSLPESILIVDDSPTDRFFLSEVVRNIDPEVRIRFADSLAVAQEMLASTVFGAILLDLNLPDANELEGLQVISELVPTTPIIVVSAYPSESFVQAALNYGADEYLNKSELDLSHVRDVLLRAIGRREGRRHYDRVGWVASRTLNVMSAPSVILDQTGRVVACNDAWRETPPEANPAISLIDVGTNYVATLHQIVGEFSETALDIASGIERVLLGNQENLFVDYSLHVGERQCSFYLRVVPLNQRGGGAVVTHLDITSIREAEEFIRDRHSQLLAVNDVSFNFVHNDKSPIFALADANGKILHSSPRTFELLGSENISGLKEPVLGRVDPLDAAMARETFLRIARAPLSSERVIIRVRDRENQQRTLDVTVTNLLDDEAVRAIAISGNDITEGRIEQITGKIQSRLLHSLPAAVIVKDSAGVIVYWNHRASLLYGYTAAETIGRTIAELGIRPQTQASIDAVVKLRGRWEGDFMAHRSDGTQVPVHATFERIEAPDINFEGVVSASIDISDRRQLEERLIHQSGHEPLTGLPNRRSFVHHLDATLAPQGKSTTSLAVLSIDFDDFRLVNDRFGHAHGDAVLRQWAARVGELMEPGDFLAHLGEDEFAICSTSAGSLDAARSVADRILDITSSPITVGNQSVSVTTTIGIAMSSPGSTAEGLMRNASLAMYSAKDLGRGRLEVFDDAYHEQIKVRNKLRAELSRAVLDHEITPYFQPEVSLETGEIVGFEALARWNRAGHRQVLPDEFIPLAEESGLIGAIGLEMLEASCQALRQWQEVSPGRRLTVAVNVSVIQLADPGFPQIVIDACRRNGVDPSQICLEMTESSLVDELVAFHALNELKATGVLIALDDFGTGYSSLLRLNRYPIDFLKIDRSFVSELSSPLHDPVVITAVLAIAKAMGISTISEGIEESIQWQRLRELGCHTGQGFLFSRAISRRQATKLIASDRRYELPSP